MTFLRTGLTVRSSLLINILGDLFLWIFYYTLRSFILDCQNINQLCHIDDKANRILFVSIKMYGERAICDDSCSSARAIHPAILECSSLLHTL